MKKALFLLSCSLGALNYETDGNVLKLGAEDFDKAREQHPDMLVKFFAPWCGHCKNLAPAYLQAATALNQSGSTVKLAEVDCTIHRPLCQKYQVKGYPTLHYFSKGVEQPTKYASGRSKDAIVSWINAKVEEAKKAAQEKPQQKEEQKKETEKQAATPEFQKQGSLFKLTEHTFDKARQKFDYLFVKFFAPWCGHCKKIAQPWLQFANSITDQKVAIAQVDCTQVKGPLCAQYGVEGYPTLKLIVKDNEVVPYKQARNIESWTSWLNEQKAKLIPGANPQKKEKQAAEEL